MWTKDVFVLINNFNLIKIKRIYDVIGHELLDINIVHLFTPYFKLYKVLLAIKLYRFSTPKETKKQQTKKNIKK